MSGEFRAAGEIDSLFSDVADAFARAAARVGVCTFDYRVADKPMRLEFAGRALLPALSRALAHLEHLSDLLPQLCVHIWEIKETGVSLPPPRWNMDAYRRRGEVDGFNDGTRFTLYHPDSRVLFLYDASNGQAFIAAFDRNTLPAYERAASLRPILFPWLATHNIQFAHAAAVGFPEGGALLVGKSGAGKSTTSLACLDSELSFAGDDYVAIEIGEKPTVHSLYNSGKASAETIRLLPFLGPHVRSRDVGGSGKAIFYFHETLPIKLIRQFPLRAILMPRVTGARETRISPASAHSALLALAPSTVSQLATADGRVFSRLATLVRSVPCWNLELGTDMTQIPGTIARLLERQIRGD